VEDPDEPRLPRGTFTSPRMPLDTLVDAARLTMPGAEVRRIVVPSGDAPVLIRMQAPGDHHHKGMERVYLDPRDATIVAAIPLTAATPAVRMFEWLYPLHVGDLFGRLHKLLLVLIGIAPTALFATGLLVWRINHPRRKRSPSGII
jgi:uncharacterized iron-regulated membrane protein